ncbi:MAG: PilZ domain-containing protein [Rhodopila sp.]
MVRVSAADCFPAMVKDLSQAGIAVVCERSFPVDTELTVELPETRVPVTGKVVHIDGGTMRIAFREDAATRQQAERAMQALTRWSVAA